LNNKKAEPFLILLFSVKIQIHPAQERSKTSQSLSALSVRQRFLHAGFLSRHVRFFLVCGLHFLQVDGNFVDLAGESVGCRNAVILNDRLSPSSPTSAPSQINTLNRNHYASH
jgi:hypothetical protein